MLVGFCWDCIAFVDHQIAENWTDHLSMNMGCLTMNVLDWKKNNIYQKQFIFLWPQALECLKQCVFNTSQFAQIISVLTWLWFISGQWPGKLFCSSMVVSSCFMIQEHREGDSMIRQCTGPVRRCVSSASLPAPTLWRMRCCSTHHPSEAPSWL